LLAIDSQPQIVEIVLHYFQQKVLLLDTITQLRRILPRTLVANFSSLDVIKSPGQVLRQLLCESLTPLNNEMSLSHLD
jgi:hypothetical protein